MARARAEAESRAAPPGLAPPVSTGAAPAGPRRGRRLVILAAVSALAAVGAGLGLTLAGSGRPASSPAATATRPGASRAPAASGPPAGAGPGPAATSPPPPNPTRPPATRPPATRPVATQPNPTRPPVTEPPVTEPPAPAPPPPAAAPPARLTVQPGQSFWTIAASVVARRVGPAPTVAEIAPYWVRLVAANSALLRRPGDADLIYPGQVLVLPAA